MKLGEDTHTLAIMPQLDSLRALSVSAVIYTHYLTEKYWLFGIYWGGLGLRCFFVLSGFLITSILLRDISDARSFKQAYLVFIFRRALRLYPILLVTLFTGAVLGIDSVRETFFWNVTYLTNFYVVKIDKWPGPIAPLWSLAVEEQFYLVWPVIIFFVPRRLLPAVLVMLIASSLLFRLGWQSAGLGDMGASVLPPGSFDALGMGALLALFKGERRLIAISGLIGLCLWLLAVVSPWVRDLWLVADGEIPITAAAMVFVWIISRAAAGFGGIAGIVLNSSTLQYIGAISYGMYVLHAFVPHYLDLTGVSYFLRPWQFKLLALGSTVLLASISWYILERPITRFGRRWMAIRVPSPGPTRPVPLTCANGIEGR